MHAATKSTKISGASHFSHPDSQQLNLGCSVSCDQPLSQSRARGRAECKAHMRSLCREVRERARRKGGLPLYTRLEPAGGSWTVYVAFGVTQCGLYSTFSHIKWSCTFLQWPHNRRYEVCVRFYVRCPAVYCMVITSGLRQVWTAGSDLECHTETTIIIIAACIAQGRWCVGGGDITHVWGLLCSILYTQKCKSLVIVGVCGVQCAGKGWRVPSTKCIMINGDKCPPHVTLQRPAQMWTGPCVWCEKFKTFFSPTP